MYSATELLSDEVKKVAQLKGLTINAYYDSDPFNPRKEWDNLGTLVSRGRNYCDEVYPSDVDIGNDIFDTATNFFKHHKIPLDSVVWLPIYSYTHGNVAYRCTAPYECRFDGGVYGFIYATKEKIRECYGVKRVTKDILERVHNCFKGEVSIFEQWCNGEVYGITIDNPVTNVESTWGIFGSDLDEVAMDMLAECDAYLNQEYEPAKAENLKNRFVKAA